MGATEPLARAIAIGRSVLSNVSKEDLDAQSPCASWKVRDVINHLVEGSDFFVTGLGGEAANVGDVTGGDYLASYDEAGERTLAAFNAPGALDKTANMPWGPLPATALMGLATSDIVTHAWDMAKATGQSTDLDPEFVTHLLPQVQQAVPDMFRGAEGSGMPFGVRQEAPEGACAADRLAAFLGRSV
ncbi:MAG TPA: TIGR03086 family metal-binding protein [Acidimicrobiales bacterium]|nr:TIGR03086 family metal-binding protein [Acidimicrobiales bacterium]